MAADGPTVTSLEADPVAKLIWQDLRDITSNERAWYVIGEHLALVRLEATGKAMVSTSEAIGKATCEAAT